MKINTRLISLKSPQAFDVILIYYHTAVPTALLGWSDTVFRPLYPKQAVTQVDVTQLLPPRSLAGRGNKAGRFLGGCFNSRWRQPSLLNIHYYIVSWGIRAAGAFLKRCELVMQELKPCCWAALCQLCTVPSCRQPSHTPCSSQKHHSHPLPSEERHGTTARHE